MKKKEIWKDIEGYEGHYQVSTLGRVKSLKRKWKTRDKLMGISLDTRGRYMCRLHINGKGRTFLVHMLVWDAFGDKPRDGYRLQIDHIDNNKLNNRIDNLQLLTHRDNVIKGWLSRKKSGLPSGVNFSKNRYRAFIAHNKKYIHLGCFDTPQEAEEVYLKKLKEVRDEEAILFQLPRVC